MSTAEYTNGREFEAAVAAKFASYGFTVEREYSIAGSRLDLFATRSVDGGPMRIAVECKFSPRPIGISTLNFYAYFSELLFERNLVDISVLVTSTDFTLSAKKSATHHRLLPLTIAELDEFFRSRFPSLSPREIIASDKGAKLAKRKPTFFVAMPFSREYNDVFIIGIREVAERVGVTAVRLDELEHNASIPELIISSIKSADALIAETTEANKNVFYEVGLAHGLGKEVIFLCKAGTEPPFDVAHINHVFYASLVELRERLEKRLRAMIR